MKIKLIIGNTLLCLFLFYGIYKLDQLIFDLPKEEVDVIVRNHTEVEENIIRSFQKQKTNDMLLSKNVSKLVQIIPKEKLVYIIPQLTDREIRFLEYKFLDLEIEELKWLEILFANMRESFIIKLVRFSSLLGQHRTDELVEVLLELQPYEREIVLYSLMRLSLSRAIDLIYMLDDVTKRDTIKFFRLLNKSSNKSVFVDFFLKLSSNQIKTFIEHISKLDEQNRDKYLELFFNSNINHTINLLSLLPTRYITDMLTFLGELNTLQLNTLLDYFVSISDAHRKRAIELIIEDKTILHDSVNLAERLNRHLRKGEGYDTMERAINTASRVDTQTRKEGLSKVSEQRSVAIRRVFKQVDGHKNTYTGNVIEQLTEDYDRVINTDKFINILTGSDGIIHGAYRADPKVTQERKLFRIREAYSGNMEKKKEVLEFFDTKPFVVPQLKEDNFIIDDPEKSLNQ